MSAHSWIEISRSAITRNVQTLRQVVGDQVLLAPCVKANAYGHGLVPTSQALVAAGANWLSVHCAQEAQRLRAAGVTVPILILGPLLDEELPLLPSLQVRLMVSDLDRLPALDASLHGQPAQLPIHLKVDTGM